MRNDRKDLPDAGAGADPMVEPVPDFTFQEFYDRLVQENRMDEKREDEFTIDEFAKDTQLSPRLANYRLKELVEKGVLKERPGRHHGRRCWLFSRAGN